MRTLAALTVSVASMPACDSQPPEPSTAAAVARLATPEPPAPRANSTAEFRAYMGALAPHMPAVFAAEEAPERCAQMADTAAETAPEALACLRESAAAAHRAAEALHAVRPPPTLADRHRELLAFADEGAVAADGYATAFGQAVPALERARRRSGLAAYWTRGMAETHPSELLERLDNEARRFEPSSAHRLAWLNQMHPMCNERFRCVPRSVSLADVQDPRNRDAHGRFIRQGNCICIRVWATLRGETPWTLLGADETNLPPWSDAP